MAEDETVRWNHRLSEHEYEQTPGSSEGQGSLVCYSPWGRKESDMTWQLDNNICCMNKRMEEKINERRNRQMHHSFSKPANFPFVDQFSSVAQSCPTLCHPMDCNTPGFPVHRQPDQL